MDNYEINENNYNLLIKLKMSLFKSIIEIGSGFLLTAVIVKVIHMRPAHVMADEIIEEQNQYELIQQAKTTKQNRDANDRTILDCKK